jgi:probable HAF family extracellular repeat protein
VTYSARLLGRLPGGSQSEVLDVSADGFVLAGQASDSLGNNQAVYWSPNITVLPQFAGGVQNAAAAGVSSDDQIIAGYATDAEGNNHAALWLSPFTGQPVDLGFLDDSSLSSQASCINASGGVVAGYSQQSIAVVPRQNETQYDIGALISVSVAQSGVVFVCTSHLTPPGISAGIIPAGYTGAGIGAVITDGQCIFHGEATPVFRQPVVWVDEEIAALTLFGGGASAIPTAISADGTVIVGVALDSTGQSHAVKWTGAPSWDVFDLGYLGTGTFAEALGISADGSNIVGASQGTDGQIHAVVWNPTIVELGLIGGTTNTLATDISDDLLTIVGGSGGQGAAVWLGGIGQLLPAPAGSSQGDALACSSTGQVIGGAAVNGSNEAAVWGPSPPLNMANVAVTSLAAESPCTVAQYTTPPSFVPALGLRWSDTRGLTFGNPVAQPFGTDPLAQPQWNRTGYARDRVFELFWSAAVKTALNGAFVIVEPWKS